MNFIIIRLYLLLLLLFSFLFSFTFSVWNGNKCHESSNSTNFEQLYSKYHTLPLFPGINDLKKCFYWIEGKFEPKLTLNIKDKRKNYHYCIQNYLNITSESRAEYRNIIRKILIHNKESIIHRSHYDCEEELPFGYFPYHHHKLLPVHWYSRQEIYSYMKGKIIWFGGNSLTRQLFQRSFIIINHYYQSLLSIVIINHYYQ